MFLEIKILKNGGHDHWPIQRNSLVFEITKQPVIGGALQDDLNSDTTKSADCGGIACENCSVFFLSHVCWPSFGAVHMSNVYQWRIEGGKMGTIPRAPNHWVAPKRPNNVASTFFNTVHLLMKHLRFEHVRAKLVYCSGCHLTSVRPCFAWKSCGCFPDSGLNFVLKKAVVGHVWTQA